MMMKTPSLKPWYRLLAFLLLLCLLLSLCQSASADKGASASTEVHVDDVQHITIDLGAAWAGTEFKYRTEEHEYPDRYTVSEDGVLDFDINSGSERYILTLIRSSEKEAGRNKNKEADTEPPAAEATEAAGDVTEPAEADEQPLESETMESPIPAAVGHAPRTIKGLMVAGLIPLKFLVVFGILFLSVLIVLTVIVVRDRMAGAAAYDAYDAEDEPEDDETEEEEGGGLYNYNP